MSNREAVPKAVAGPAALRVVAGTGVANAAAPEHGMVLIVTMKVAEFETFFSAWPTHNASVFSTGAEAMIFWRNKALSPDTIFFIDYATFGDHETGFRLLRTIRDAEKADGATPCSIYLMADQPKPMDEILATRLGANGILQKTPQAALGLLLVGKPGAVGVTAAPAAPTREERRKRHPEQGSSRPVFTPELRKRIAHVNGILRRFIGAAATMVSDNAFDLMSKGRLAPTEEAYTAYLASCIPDEESVQGFLEMIKK